MKLLMGKRAALILASLFLMGLAADNVSTAQPPPPLPNPILIFLGPEFYVNNGKQFIRYRYSVFNMDQYPNTLFAPAPLLPPCGLNKNSSRTWVDIYDQSGKRLYGFCALNSNTGLGELWFALEEGVLPPSWVYIEMNDRQTNTKYKSNLAETTL